MNRALILADLEGIFNVYELEQIEQCREAYLYEVSAYVDALLQSGVTAIDVCDTHNEGTLLFPLEQRYAGRDIHVIQTIENIRFDREYSFAMMVGFHGMEGSRGVLPHSLRFDFRQVAVFSEADHSCVPIGEGELYSRWLGSKDIPVILVTGDREAVYEGNCFNPYRATCCVKSLFENSVAAEELVFGKIRSGVKAALDLDFLSCLSADNDPLLVSFVHEDLPPFLVDHGYPVKDGWLVFDSCSAFVSQLYDLVDRLIEFDQQTIAANRKFLQQLREITPRIEKDAFDNSEEGKMLSAHTIFTLNSRTREAVREKLAF